MNSLTPDKLSKILNHFNCNVDTSLVASFVQQRLKILPKTFEYLFHLLVERTDQNIIYKGFCLLTVDGSDLHVPTNKDDSDSYFPRINDQRFYNLLHLNTIYDICQGTYIDSIIQKSRVLNANSELIKMSDGTQASSPVLVISDRGYESYNAWHISRRKVGNYF